MKKVAVIYWSGTGNTQAMADAVVEGAREAGADVTLFQVSDFFDSMMDDYDAFAFGCPAMGDEELEDIEFAPLLPKLQRICIDIAAVISSHNIFEVQVRTR